MNKHQKVDKCGGVRLSLERGDSFQHDRHSVSVDVTSVFCFCKIPLTKRQHQKAKPCELYFSFYFFKAYSWICTINHCLLFLSGHQYPSQTTVSFGASSELTVLVRVFQQTQTFQASVQPNVLYVVALVPLSRSNIFITRKQSYTHANPPPPPLTWLGVHTKDPGVMNGVYGNGFHCCMTWKKAAFPSCFSLALAYKPTDCP